MADEDVRINIHSQADTTAIENYEREIESLKEELAAAREKMVELAESPEVSDEKVGEAVEEVKKLDKALKGAEANLKKATAAAGQNARATDQAADSTQRHAESLRRAERAAQDGVATLEELTEWLEKKEDAERKAAEAEKDSAELTRIRRANQAQALAQLGNGITQIGARLRQEAREISAFDDELGQTLDSLGEVAEATGGVVDGAVTGFAIGGPIGAAVGGLAGLIKDKLLKEFNDMTEAIEKQARSADRYKTSINNLRQSLEDVGREAARDRLSKFQDRLNDELETIRQLNDEIDHNIRLQKIRNDSEQRVQAINRQAELDEIDRQVATGERTPGDGAIAKAQIALRGQSEQADASLDPQRNEIAALQANQQALFEAWNAQGEMIRQLSEATAEAQRLLNGSSDTSNDDLALFVESQSNLIKELGFSRIEDRAQFEEFVTLAESEIEKLENSSSKTATDLESIGNQIQRATEEFDTLKSTRANELAAEMEREVARIRGEFEAQSKDIIRPAFETVRDELTAFGRQLSDGERESLAQLENIATNSEDDRTERSKFLEVLRQLTDGNFELYSRALRQANDGVIALDQLRNKVQQLESRTSEVISRIDQLDIRR